MDWLIEPLIGWLIELFIALFIELSIEWQIDLLPDCTTYWLIEIFIE
jgi:hypothetical protein